MLTIALANSFARDESPSADAVFWIGMLMIWLPTAARVCGSAATRNERMGLVLMLGLAVFHVKLLYSPNYFVYHDELLHQRTAQDIIDTGRFFSQNPVLPVSPLYPGLEIATSAIVELTGLSLFVAGNVVVGVARVIFVLALFLFFEKISRSSWVAGVAVLVYMTNPKFLFFDASYGYESLALPLAVFALYLIATAAGSPRRAFPTRMTLLIALPLVAVAVTHHVTSFVLAAMMFLIAAASLATFGRTNSSTAWPWRLALLGVTAPLVWLLFIATPVVEYLSAPITGGIDEVLGLIRRENSGRRLFHNFSGEVTPAWERVVSYEFAAITLGAFAIGWLRVARRGAWRRNAVLAALMLAAAAYPLSGVFRFAAAGAELADRASAFVFVPAALFIAYAVAGVDGHSRAARLHAGTLVLATAILFVGGIVVGQGQSWRRLPGPYLVSADARSVDAKGIAAASWARTHLTGGRIAADRTNRLLMLTYGRQRPVSTLVDNVDVSPVFLSPRLSRFERRLLGRGAVRFLVVDYRLTTALPRVGAYYELSEPGALAHVRPIPRPWLAKFDRLPLGSRLFDNGDIAIYDVSRIAGRDAP